MRKPTWWRWLSANCRGYFWLPCSACGKNFGGNEWDGTAPYLGHGRFGSGVCPDCVEETLRRTKEVCANEKVTVNAETGVWTYTSN